MTLSTKIPHAIEKQLDDSVFVGRLATETEIHSQTFHEAPIEISERSNQLFFYIKCLSPLPNELTRHFGKMHHLLTGNTITQQHRRLFNELTDFERLPFPSIKPKVQEMFEDKLILFKLISVNDKLYVELLKLEPIKPSESYITIPAPDLRTGETADDLQKKITTEKRPITLRKYPKLFSSPEFIMHEETFYKVDLYSKSNATTYFQNDGVEVEYAPVDPDLLLDAVDAVYEHHLYFLSQENYNRILEQFQKNRKSLRESSVKTSEPQTKAEPEVKQVVPSAAPISMHHTDSTETEFLESLIHKASYEYKMFYRNEDLYSFHISVKTNPLTILGGMSGTGKSQLARIYGESLGLVEGETMLFLPISPSYQDPNDILGYMNPTTNEFYESDTGLIKLLQHAEEYPDELHMVIFDEMNLSQVEHWFSPFLSLLENKGDQYLSIFNDDIEEKSGRYRSKIKLGDNLIFIGTVNFDETTKTFSDRLLDRTNIITPEKPPFKDTIDFYKRVHQEDTKAPAQLSVNAQQLRREWRYDPKDIGLHLLNEYEIHTLDKIHRLMNDSDPQKGVSFRVALAIVEFLYNVPQNQEGEDLISRRRLFDFQINQRILTKIKGIDTFAGPIVGEMKQLDGQFNYSGGTLADLFTSDQAQFASDFELSLQTLKNKAKELMMYGFTN